MLTVIELTDKKYSNGSVLWKCQCDCGGITCTTYTNLKKGSVYSCGCRHRSKMEEYIENLLKEFKINYESEKRFDDCRNLKGSDMLPFDFYLPDFNSIIEYDGEHHFRPVEYWGGEEKFKKTQENDKIKNDYCNKKNIKLIRLSYLLKEEEIKEQILDVLNP